MSSRISACGVLSVAALWASTGVASAQSDPGVHVDPKSSDPPGVIYQLPLDSARGDASPKGSGGGNGGDKGSRNQSGAAGAGGGSGGGGSAGGGSGPPGNAGGGGSGSGSGSGSNAGGSGSGGESLQAAVGGHARSLVHSENGLGSSSLVPGLGYGGPGDASGQPVAAVQGNGGGGGAIPLALLIGVLLVGGVAAVAGRRAAKGRG